MSIVCPHCDEQQETAEVMDGLLGSMTCIGCGEDMELDLYERNLILEPFLKHLVALVPGLPLVIELEKDPAEEDEAPQQTAIQKAAAAGDLAAAISKGKATAFTRFYLRSRHAEDIFVTKNGCLALCRRRNKDGSLRGALPFPTKQEAEAFSQGRYAVVPDMQQVN
jgi:hypothetical protein